MSSTKISYININYQINYYKAIDPIHIYNALLYSAIYCRTNQAQVYWSPYPSKLAHFHYLNTNTNRNINRNINKNRNRNRNRDYICNYRLDRT